MKQTKKTANGTSFHDSVINTTLVELKRVCGEPICGDNDGEDKVNYEFNMETDNGEVFTIYDWKEYRPIAKDEVIEWHIGGKSQYITETAKEELLKAINSEEESKASNETIHPGIGKRQIELTHEQLDLLVSCLFIASSEYSKQFTEMCNKFPNDDKETKMYWHNKSGIVYDLAADIKDGKLDI